MPYNITLSIPQSSTLRSFSNFKKETLGLDTELTAVFHYKKNNPQVCNDCKTYSILWMKGFNTLYRIKDF